MFAVALVHGVGDVWAFGHEGWMGASFGNAARNTLRHGVLGQAWHHFGPAKPLPDAFYTHHPMLVHAHLVLVQALFGSTAAASRLVPMFYSLGCALLVAQLGRRCWNARVAVLAALVFVTIPLTVVFGRTPTHEQGGLFWSLALVSLYLSWWQKPQKKHLWTLPLVATLACQYDFPAYYLVFFLFVHALTIAGLASGPEAHRFYRLSFGLAAVAAFNLLLFLAIVHHIRGLDDLFSSFDYRRKTIGDTHAQLRMYWLDLFGLWWCGALGLWSCWAGWRAMQWRVHRGDLLVLLFVGMQLIHNTAFPGAAFFHGYWQYCLVAAVSLAAASTLDAVGRMLLRVLRHRFGMRPWLATATALLALTWVVGLQLRSTWPTTLHLLDTRGTPEAFYRPGLRRNRWAAFLSQQRAAHRPVRYLIDANAYLASVQLAYHLDAATTQVDAAVAPLADWLAGHEAPVLLFDLHYHDPWRWDAIAARARTFHTELWDRRFLLVYPRVPREPNAAVQSWVAVERRRTWWWSWLVSPVLGPLQWQRDPEVAWTEQLLQPKPPGQTLWLSTPETEKLRWDCLPGQQVIALEQVRQDGHVRLLRGICRTAATNAQPMDSVGPWFGRWSRRPRRRLACANHQAVVGLRVKLVDDQLTQLEPECAGALFQTPDATSTSHQRCPEGQVMVGLRLVELAELGRLAMACGRVVP